MDKFAFAEIVTESDTPDVSEDSENFGNEEEKKE